MEAGTGRIGGTVRRFETVDSTSDVLKRLAQEGAPEGLAVIAEEQTAGRGRQGRGFLSPKGEGLYLSVLLRPHCTAQAASNVTAWVAVAVCDGIEAACGVRPGIKWTNDIILQGRKLCGILTELSLDAEGGLAHLICGIGVNVSQTNFGEEVGAVAISLGQALGAVPPRSTLEQALLQALDGMYHQFPHDWAHVLEQYRRDCLTTGQEVRLVRNGQSVSAFALGIDDDFALRVRYGDGRVEAIRAGEVSVRGLLGYA